MSERVTDENDYIVKWPELTPAPDVHHCDCGYCEVNGELEPIKWPTLVRLTVAGVQYVTDRHFAIRADLAPIPGDWPGPALDGPAVDSDSNRVFALTGVTDEAPDGVPFLWSTMNALRMTQTVLRRMEQPEDASEHVRRSYAIVTREGEHVGWAMASKAHQPDYYEDNTTWSYSDALASGDLVTPSGKPGDPA